MKEKKTFGRIKENKERQKVKIEVIIKKKKNYNIGKIKVQ